MTRWGWRLAAIVILLAAIGFRLSRSGGTPSEAANENQTADATEVEPTELGPVGAGPTVRAADGDHQQQAGVLLRHISRGTQRMTAAGRRFSESVVETIAAEDPASIQLQQQLDETLKVIRDVRSQVRDSGEPTFPAGQRLHAAYLQYLDWQEEVYVQDYAAMVKDLQKSGRTMSERQNIALAVLTERSQDEQSRNEKIDALRRDLRKEASAR